MKVVAYCVKSNEKILLAQANLKKHDITLISNDVTHDTVNYANGKDAVIICNNCNMSEDILAAFARLGIKFLITRTLKKESLADFALTEYGILIHTLCKNSANFSPENLLVDQVSDSITLKKLYTDTISMLDIWQKMYD